MVKKRIIFPLVFLFILIPFLAISYFSPGKATGFVNDFAGLLTSGQKQDLEIKLVNFERETTNEISVVIISSLQGDTIENFAVELFEEWGIGKKDKDNGVLILIARQDRKMRIEVGYGLEEFLTDAQSYWIINNVMKPAFQGEDYYGGINGAVDKIIGATKGEVIPADNSETEINYLTRFFISSVFLIWLISILGRSRSWWLGGVIGGIISLIITQFKGFILTGLLSFIFLVPFGLLLDFLVSRAYGEAKRIGGRIPWWAGGRGFGGGFGSGSRRGGGGFGGFGGGSSGGGGASGRW